ncbi:MAG: ATP-binding protein [Sphingobacteriales bacterium]|nr:ATP-binding protein [Sphingobacteriales bacterium]
MIINFSIQNFGSIKDKQILSFEADKTTHLEDTYIVNIGGHRLLKLALIYGANASGKTTILKALDFLRKLVIAPQEKKTNILNFEPFLFDPNTPKQPSVISIEFFQNEVKYYYEVEFIKKAILSEELYYYNPNKANIFKRKTNLENQVAKIEFGSKISIDKTTKKILEANTIWNNTVLGGYLKTNIDLKELQEVSDWFKNYLFKLIVPEDTSLLNNFVKRMILGKQISNADVVSILKKADFNISAIDIIERDISVFGNKLSEFLLERSKESMYYFEVAHTVNNTKYTLPLELESQGTNRYLGFAGLLAYIIKKPTALPIDELEASLHPDLYLHFLLSFLLNAKKSQLIATTHNREILDNKDIFRDDAIWFTDKQKGSATQVYSLADFDSTVIRNTTNILNAYKTGKLSATPNLGDTFIDLTHEKNQ